MKILTAALCFLLSSGSLFGCLWDRDTMAEEVGGRLLEVKTLLGWFDRNPPLYYEMRLNRISAAIESDKENWNLYDDAAVACDRLGKPDSAIGWMERKQIAMTGSGSAPADEVRYRTAANLGTFYAHRWIKRPRDERNADLSDLERAGELINEALKINPNAHFGRESAQLIFLTSLQMDEMDFYLFRASKIEGLIGLVRLGAAWESQDVFRAIAAVSARTRDGNIRYLAEERLAQLVDEQDGNRSIHPAFDPADSDSFAQHFAISGASLAPEAVKIVEPWYAKALDAAQQRHRARTAYMLARLNKGQHPDTHPDFWQQWNEPEFPELPDNYVTSWEDQMRRYGYIGLSVAIVMLIGLFILKRYLRRREKRFALSR